MPFMRAPNCATGPHGEVFCRSNSHGNEPGRHGQPLLGVVRPLLATRNAFLRMIEPKVPCGRSRGLDDEPTTRGRARRGLGAARAPRTPAQTQDDAKNNYLKRE